MQTAEGSYIAQAEVGASATVNVSKYYYLTPQATLTPETLTAAKALFCQLPLHEVSLPGDIPACSRMPLRRNALFVGREGQLLGDWMKEEHESALWPNKTDPQRQRRQLLWVSLVIALTGAIVASIAWLTLG